MGAMEATVLLAGKPDAAAATHHGLGHQASDVTMED